MSSEIAEREAEKTASIPRPGTGLEPADPKRIKRMQMEMAEVRAAMEVMSRSLKVAMADYDALRKLVFGDEQSTTHACPIEGTGIMPCCGKGTMDVPLTEPITLNLDAVTCQGASLS